MNQRLLAEIGRTQRLEILNALKRTEGLSVNELVDKMKMSYMGIKQHCLTLQRDGYLDTWRRPQKMGRPEMVYRLTRRSHDLFPGRQQSISRWNCCNRSRRFTARTRRKNCSTTCLNGRRASLKEKVKGETVAERAKWLAQHPRCRRLHVAIRHESNEGGPQILECHSPIMNLAR